MSEPKGPRPLAWEGWHADVKGVRTRRGRVGFVDVQEYEDDGDGGEMAERHYTMTPDEAEKHGHALIMAAAVARGEQGHTAALNRVAVALGDGAVVVRDMPGGAARSLSALMDERDRLRRDCDAAAEACGVAVVGHVPEVWRLLSEARDEAVAERDAAREELAAARHALGVVGNGSPVLAAWSLRHECAALREDLAAAEAARAEAVQEAARLRVELGEAREALAGKTQHDAAAEVVAPLRERLGVGGEVSPGFVVQQAVRLIPSVVQMGGSPTWCKCGGERSGAWCTNCANPTREPMTHTSLASIEEHGVVVGDRLECVVGKTPRDPLSGFAVEAIRMRAALALLGVLVRDAAGRRQSPAFDDLAWPLTVVEAPDAD